MTSSQSKLLSRACLSVLFVLAGSAAAQVADNADARIRQALQRDLGMDTAQAERLLQAGRLARASETTIRRTLADGYAGSWIERGDDGRVRIVAATAGAQRSAGASAVELRRVRYSHKQLEAGQQALDRDAARRVAGVSKSLDGVQSWYVDPKRNRVVIEVRAGAVATAVEFAAVSGIDAGLVDVVESAGVAASYANVVGGTHLDTTNGRGFISGCSIGFPVLGSNNTRGFLTAGHCGTSGGRIDFDGGRGRGTVRESNYPGGDYAFVTVGASDTAETWITRPDGSQLPIRGSTEAAIGAAVCKRGNRTGFTCGEIVGRNASHMRPQGLVTGLAVANFCAGQGDSGGAVFDLGGQAQGLISGGDSGPPDGTHNCNVATAQRRAYYYPIVAALNSTLSRLVTQN